MALAAWVGRRAYHVFSFLPTQQIYVFSFCNDDYIAFALVRLFILEWYFLDWVDSALNSLNTERDLRLGIWDTLLKLHAFYCNKICDWFTFLFAVIFVCDHNVRDFSECTWNGRQIGIVAAYLFNPLNLVQATLLTHWMH